jgi:hypothetical protein
LTKSKYAYFGTHYCLSTQDRAKLEVEWSKLEAKAQASLDALTVRYSDACKALGGLADVDGESAVAQGRKKVHFGGRGNPAAGYTYCMMTTAVSEQVSCQCGTAE